MVRATSAVIVCVLALALVPSGHRPVGIPSGPGLALSADDATGYARALEPRRFVFPDDHAAHPDFRTEWWYLTGNLRDATGRRFGYQFTLFRRALAPGPAEARTSAWATHQYWFAHLAVSDVAAGRFVHDERQARGALDLAGAQPRRVWIGTWRLTGTPETGLHLAAASTGFALALDLAPGPGPILRGEAGLSAKSDQPGNNSYYYAFPRLPTSGTLRLDGRAHRVTGASWYDREWSSSALARDQVGWDWFALHLADGRDLLLFQLRDAAGARDYAAGAISGPEGEATSLAMATVALHPTRWWTSPRSGSRYPVAWRLAVPALDLRGEIRAVLSDQEHRGGFTYWEGAVDLDGSHPGVGYLEMTGY